MNSKVALQTFHGLMDSAAAHQTSVLLNPPVPHITPNLGYRFYTHFHPYVLELIKRLNAGGVPGMQSADTEYVRDSDGNIQTLPDSTRATLGASATATRVADGVSITVSASSPVTLPDGTLLSVADQTLITPLNPGDPAVLSPAAQVKLRGSIPGSLPSGCLYVTVSNVKIVLPERSPVTLVAASTAFLSDGTALLLPAGTALNVSSPEPLPTLFKAIFTTSDYVPNTAVVQQPYPVRDLDFSSGGAYSIYNWELFFHIPLLVAVQLSANQRFQDAQRWFHFVFDPTDSSRGPTPQRFWKVRPFQTTDVQLIESILTNLSTGADPQLQLETQRSLVDWTDNPFQPFIVGRFRPTAFMLKTVMAYLDNLIAWGDSLFQLYTVETINEATQLYVLAANILGERPRVIPEKNQVGPASYADLRGSLDAFGNAMRDIEVDIPFDLTLPPSSTVNSSGASTLNSIGQSLFFCIPRNTKLLAYWDTVADRLFKIHNSLNLQGVFQAVPLFDPPIDPALLVRATAAGLDVAAVINGLDQPLPLVRFQLLVARSAEIAQEVKSLGAGLLAALEKSDNEGLSLLRSHHEITLLGLMESVKYSQWQDAIKTREGLEQSLANASNRYVYYQKQLGMQDTQISIPSLEALDGNGLEQLAYQNSEPKINLQAIAVDIDQDSASVSDGEVKTLSHHEVEEIDKLALARDLQLTATALEGLSSGLGLIPQFKANVEPLGVGAGFGFGGVQLSHMVSALGSVARIVAEEFSYEAGKTGKLGGYARREQEWTNQSNLAAGEINLIFKQLRGAQIREAIAEQEFKNHQTQMTQAQVVQDFLQNKDTSQGLYLWMKGQIRTLYNQVFQLAFQVARKAERALQRELGDPSQSFIQFSYRDGMQGLLAGERLYADIKRMEMAYYDLNRREYELIKHVSLFQVAPRALLQLRAKGSCQITLTEDLFDLDNPGHYFRRINSVSVSIPCVVGPYASVNCTLTLLNSSVRVTPTVGTGYPRVGVNDDRFSDNFSSIESMVTSSGQSDNGLFDPKPQDERYRPFELSGAISTWQLTLPADFPQFDFDTISDVILHVKFTAREGGVPLASAANSNILSLVKAAMAPGSVRMVSVRRDFPNEWAQFTAKPAASTSAPAPLVIPLASQHYPYWARQWIESNKVALTAIEFLAEMSSSTINSVKIFAKADKSGNVDSLDNDPDFKPLLTGVLEKLKPLPAAVKDSTHPPLSLYFENNAMTDLWMAITWNANP